MWLSERWWYHCLIMPLTEFDIIQRYFASHSIQSRYSVQGIGDDAALLRVPQDFDLVTSIDTLNEGIHFDKTVAAYDLGYKALAVSISDIAAMGASPFSALLTLSLPAADEGWLSEFAAGFFAIADQFSVDLVGGDITRGPLSVSTIVNGLIPEGKALMRSGANVGDLIYVTGTLGDAALAFKLMSEQAEPIAKALLERLNRPQPRVEAGLALRDVATSAMDISDGLAADLGKLCVASGVGAELFAKRLPLSSHLQNLPTDEQAWYLALTFGDDYELVFTVPPQYKSKLDALQLGVEITCVGEITSTPGVSVKDKTGAEMMLKSAGYEHFKENT